MGDVLANVYLWVKVAHVISVISWMAGLFYLPRLYVHHTERASNGTETDVLFQMMEQKLFKLIMVPAMLSTWLFGMLLVVTPGIVDWSDGWPYAKAIGVIAMTWFHYWLGQRRHDFVSGTNTRSGRTYRLMNELPTVLMIVIVAAVIARPF